MKEAIETQIANEQEKFNGCYRDEKGKMVKKEVAEANGWRKVGKDGKATPTAKYWNARKRSIKAKLKKEQDELKAKQKAKAQAERDAKRAEEEKLKQAKRESRAAAKALKEEKALAEKEAKQKQLEALRSKLRKEGVDEEDLPKRLPKSTEYGEYNGIKSPYDQKRRSGYLYIWQVLAETPDEWVPWNKLETEALERFTEAHPDYIAAKYGEGNEYDIRRQVGVMDRSPYNQPLEKIGQRVIKSPSKGVMLVSDTQGETYEQFKARKRGKNVEAQVPTGIALPEKETTQTTVTA